MFAINDAAKAKKSARALEKFLKKHGQDLGHGLALNALAAMAGFEDWNGLQAQLKDAPAAEAFIPNIWDVNFRKVNIVNVFGSDYAIDDFEDFDRVKEWLANWSNSENPFRDTNPVALRLVSQNEDAYGSAVLRVKEFLSFKWDAKQQCFVNPGEGRMSVYTLTPYQFESDSAKTDWIAPAAPSVNSAPSGPTILDVDFSRVTGLNKGGEGFWVDSRHYSEALDWLHDWNNPANENDPDVPVLELTYIDDDGFVAHTQILADELLSLKWSKSKGLFVSPEGIEYKFEYQIPVAPGVLSIGTEARRSVTAPTVGEDVVTPPKRYVVYVYALDSTEDTSLGREFVDTWEGTAHDLDEAESKALAEVWYERREQSGASPSVEVSLVDDEEHGPFTLLAVGQGTQKAFDSFKETWMLGAGLSKRHGGLHEVQIVDIEGHYVYTFPKK